MALAIELSQEIACLLQFDLNSMQTGVKVHSQQASPETVQAMARLWRKGLITQQDGGYLTSLGHEAAEHAQALWTIITSE